MDIPRDLVEQAGVSTGGGPMHTLKYSLLSIFKTPRFVLGVVIGNECNN